jgi:hypothetical protein
MKWFTQYKERGNFPVDEQSGKPRLRRAYKIGETKYLFDGIESKNDGKGMMIITVYLKRLFQIILIGGCIYYAFIK